MVLLESALFLLLHTSHNIPANKRWHNRDWEMQTIRKKVYLCRDSRMLPAFYINNLSLSVANTSTSTLPRVIAPCYYIEQPTAKICVPIDI